MISSDSGIVTTVNGFPLKSLGKTLVKFVIQSQVFPCEAHVIEGLTYDVILGRDFLQKCSSNIDFDKARIELSHPENPLPFSGMEAAVSDDYSANDTAFVCSAHAHFSSVIPPELDLCLLDRHYLKSILSLELQN